MTRESRSSPTGRGSGCSAATRTHHRCSRGRSYYYTSVQGDDEKLNATRLALRDLGFEPNVFKKVKGTPSKGVDVSLTTDVVSLAYRGAYDVAYLIAGDGDYVPLVEEVKRAGARVVVAFFENHGLNNELRVVADDFVDLTDKARVRPGRRVGAMGTNGHKRPR